MKMRKREKEERRGKKEKIGERGELRKTRVKIE
jgi:hypothetical protein